MLRNQPIHLCLDCHGKETIRKDGSKIPGMLGLNDPKQHKHGPLSEGDCAGCHSVHGADHRALLPLPYTREFYQAPDPQAYSLCFSCHKPELAADKISTTATNFRNGDLNLHYVHVTEPGDKGRSCRACHSTHTSHNRQQLLDSVPYGQWSVPINFAATETGGTCGAGCHRARSYDREAALAPD
jgi:predicted CXXCH cytochrome family protein